MLYCTAVDTKRFCVHTTSVGEGGTLLGPLGRVSCWDTETALPQLSVHEAGKGSIGPTRRGHASNASKNACVGHVRHGCLTSRLCDTVTYCMLTVSIWILTSVQPCVLSQRKESRYLVEVIAAVHHTPCRARAGSRPQVPRARERPLRSSQRTSHPNSFPNPDPMLSDATISRLSLHEESTRSSFPVFSMRIYRLCLFSSYSALPLSWS